MSNVKEKGSSDSDPRKVGNGQSEEAYLDKISELRVEIETLTSEATELISIKDRAIGDAKNAKADFESLQRRIVEATKRLTDLEIEIQDRRLSHTEEIKKNAQRIGEAKNEIDRLEIELVGIVKKISELQKYITELLPMKKVYEETLALLEQSKAELVKTNKHLSNLEFKLEQKRKDEKAELDILKKARLQHENDIARIEKSKDWIVEQKKMMQEFCEANGLPFNITIQAIEGE